MNVIENVSLGLALYVVIKVSILAVFYWAVKASKVAEPTKVVIPKPSGNPPSPMNGYSSE